LIQTPEKRYVLEQAITTIATVADSAEDKFLNVFLFLFFFFLPKTLFDSFFYLLFEIVL